jgi:hypothetical protein
MTSAGDSGTPLAGKLGIAAGLRAAALDAPGNYRSGVAPRRERVVSVAR